MLFFLQFPSHSPSHHMLRQPSPTSPHPQTHEAQSSGQSVCRLIVCYTGGRRSSSHFTFSDTCVWKPSIKREERETRVWDRTKVNGVRNGWGRSERKWRMTGVIVGVFFVCVKSEEQRSSDMQVEEQKTRKKTTTVHEKCWKATNPSRLVNK